MRWSWWTWTRSTSASPRQVRFFSATHTRHAHTHTRTPPRARAHTDTHLAHLTHTPHTHTHTLYFSVSLSYLLGFFIFCKLLPKWSWRYLYSLFERAPTIYIYIYPIFTGICINSCFLRWGILQQPMPHRTVDHLKSCEGFLHIFLLCILNYNTGGGGFLSKNVYKPFWFTSILTQEHSFPVHCVESADSGKDWIFFPSEFDKLATACLKVVVLISGNYIFVRCRLRSSDQASFCWIRPSGQVCYLI